MRFEQTSYTPGRLLVWVSLCGLMGCPADPQAESALGPPPAGPDVFAYDGITLDLVPFDTIALPLPETTDTLGDGPSLDAPESDALPATLQARTCEHVFRFVPADGETPTSVHVAGTFNGWDPAGLALAPEADGVWEGTLDMVPLAAGSHGYKFVVDGDDWRLDEGAMMRRFDEEIENSKLLVPQCQAPLLEVLEASADPAQGSVKIEVAVQTGVDGALDPGSLTVSHGFMTLAEVWDPARGTFLVELEGLDPGKHTFRFDASGPAGPAEPLVVSFWLEDEVFDWRDATLYFAFTDRFRDGDDGDSPLDCLPEDSIANWLGGDWAGIREAIEEGYFDAMGIRALWLSAPMDNPDDCVTGTAGRTYTAYHGYFPSQTGETEPRFGSLEELQSLVATAHSHGIRVLVDLVVNHVYSSAAEWIEHEADGWFNADGLCKDQGWEPAETCWFETYMPDLDHRNDAVVEHMSEVALMWLREADLDGFRIDAAKHVHRHFFYTFRHKVDARITRHADQPLWMVGETFTGAWGGGTGGAEALIASYIGPDLLDGQFDFTLFWPLLDALAKETKPLDQLGEVLVGTHAYYGPDAVMSAFLGNHDLPRFISVAAGQSVDTCPDGSWPAAWNCPPPTVEDPEPYARLLRAFTVLAAGPEVPLVYYGDEIGLPGAGDPDNRRMMPWEGLTPQQEELREQVRMLLTARAGSQALRRGTVTVPESSATHLVLRRETDSDVAYGLVNLSQSSKAVTLEVPGGGSLRDAVTDVKWQAQGESLSLEIPSRSALLLVR